MGGGGVVANILYYLPTWFSSIWWLLVQMPRFDRTKCYQLDPTCQLPPPPLFTVKENYLKKKIGHYYAQ